MYWKKKSLATYLVQQMCMFEYSMMETLNGYDTSVLEEIISKI
jgi:hypothetical protein